MSWWWTCHLVPEVTGGKITTVLVSANKTTLLSQSSCPFAKSCQDIRLVQANENDGQQCVLKRLSKAHGTTIAPFKTTQVPESWKRLGIPGWTLLNLWVTANDTRLLIFSGLDNVVLLGYSYKFLQSIPSMLWVNMIYTLELVTWSILTIFYNLP